MAKLEVAICDFKLGRNKKDPLVFTEQGVAMLSSVLNSETAIQVNNQIIRMFTEMKQLILDNKDLWMKIEKIEQQLVKHDEEIKTICIFEKIINTGAKTTKPNWLSG